MGKKICLGVLLFVGVCSSGASAQSYLSTTADLALSFYQRVMSPVRQGAGHCQFSPSCSQYSREAIHEYGSFVGVVLTADRLMRCGVHATRGEYPYEGKRFSDPAAKNYLFGNGGLWKLGGSRKLFTFDTAFKPAPAYQFPYKLFLDGEYDYSIIELKRLQATTENPEERSYAYTLTAIDQFANHNIKKARVEIDRVDHTVLTPIHRRNSFLVDYVIADAEDLDAWNASRCRDAVRERSIRELDVLSRMEVYSLVKAGAYDSGRTKGALVKPKTEDFVTRVEESGSKSDVLAGIMSAVLPGSGYVYAGKWKEGISALSFNALLGWGIYSLFKNHNTGSAILLSSFALPFYLGNIVGATNAAQAENAKDRQIALGALRNALELEFYFSMEFLKTCWQ